MLLLAWGCRGIMMSSNAFNMMNMEMVPAEYRGRWTGFVSLFQNLLRIPSILIGGYIYENFNPALVFIIPLIVDVLVRMPLLNSIPDTLNSEREHFAE
jgi:MFS family permease